MAAKRRMLTNEYCGFLMETKIGQVAFNPTPSAAGSRLQPCLFNQPTEIWTNCFATATFKNGANYVGEWKQGKRHGQGTYNYASNDKYVGAWKDGKRQGQGSYTYSNGARYVGEFKDGKVHGHGIYTYANGAKYVGEFQNGKVHGRGTYSNTDGVITEGVWGNDKFLYDQKPTSPTNQKAVTKTPP